MRKNPINRRSWLLVFVACVFVTACAGAFVKPSGDTLVQSAKEYWEARSKGDWAKAYSFEAHQAEEPFAEYSTRLASSSGKLPLELMSVSNPMFEEATGIGKVEVMLKLQFKYPARGSIKQKVSDPWVFKNGRWYHDARPEMKH
ncbi:MAG: hypothetical protein HY788_20235 [Deltaproteobacteria bacterium]|nr:hypothetical protein [Deltaproteobacteria bacterium]